MHSNSLALQVNINYHEACLCDKEYRNTSSSDLGSGFVVSRRFLAIPVVLGDVQGELCFCCQ